MKPPKNLIYRFDSGSGTALLIRQTGQQDFAYSPLDTPATASGAVILFSPVPAAPPIKRAVAFVDGQNLYRSAKTAFGYHYPNHDVHVFWRLLRYRNESVRLPDGTELSVLVGREKGVDVRLALDIVRLAHRQEYDVALVFSQDQDSSEVAVEIRLISRAQDRWLKMACAFPVSPVIPKPHGINGTDWIKIDRAAYCACLDPQDYRPKPKT